MGGYTLPSGSTPSVPEFDVCVHAVDQTSYSFLPLSS